MPAFNTTPDLTVVINCGNRFTKMIVNGVLQPVVSSGLRVAKPDYRVGVDSSQAVDQSVATLKNVNQVFCIKYGNRPPAQPSTHEVWMQDSNPNALHPSACDSKIGKAMFVIPKFASNYWSKLKATQTVRFVVSVDQPDLMKDAVKALVGTYPVHYRGEVKTITVTSAVVTREGRGVMESAGTTTLLDLGGSTVIVTPLEEGKLANVKPYAIPRLGYNGLAIEIATAAQTAPGSDGKRPSASAVMKMLRCPEGDQVEIVSRAVRHYVKRVLSETSLDEALNEHYTLVGGLACSSIVVQGFRDQIERCGGTVAVVEGDPQVADIIAVWKSFVISRASAGEALPPYKGAAKAR